MTPPSSLRRSGHVYFVCIEKVNSKETYQKVKLLKQEGYRITGTILLSSGKTTIVAEKVFKDSFIIACIYRYPKPRSFSI